MSDKEDGYTQDERRFIKEMDMFTTNEHGVYIYKSTDGTNSFNLVEILRDYREWLMENNIVENTKYGC